MCLLRYSFASVRSDHFQLARARYRLEHVAGIHCAYRRSPAPPTVCSPLRRTNNAYPFRARTSVSTRIQAPPGNSPRDTVAPWRRASRMSDPKRSSFVSRRTFGNVACVHDGAGASPFHDRGPLADPRIHLSIPTDLFFVLTERICNDAPNLRRPRFRYGIRGGPPCIGYQFAPTSQCFRTRPRHRRHHALVATESRVSAAETLPFRDPLSRGGGAPHRSTRPSFERAIHGCSTRDVLVLQAPGRLFRGCRANRASAWSRRPHGSGSPGAPVVRRRRSRSLSNGGHAARRDWPPAASEATAPPFGLLDHARSRGARRPDSVVTKRIAFVWASCNAFFATLGQAVHVHRFHLLANGEADALPVRDRLMRSSRSRP